MQLYIGKPIQSKLPKDTFRVIVPSMEGDADDEHEVVIDVATEKEVFELYTQWELLRKQPTDDYHSLPFFEHSAWCDSIYYSCYSDRYDSLGDFNVTWFNEQGIEHKVTIIE